jgi:hypothetical protein
MVHGVHKSISNCFSSFLKNKKKGGGNWGLDRKANANCLGPKSYKGSER